MALIDDLIMGGEGLDLSGGLSGSPVGPVSPVEENDALADFDVDTFDWQQALANEAEKVRPRNPVVAGFEGLAVGAQQTIQGVAKGMPLLLDEGEFGRSMLDKFSLLIDDAVDGLTSPEMQARVGAAQEGPLAPTSFDEIDDSARLWSTAVATNLPRWVLSHVSGVVGDIVGGKFIGLALGLGASAADGIPDPTDLGKIALGERLGSLAGQMVGGMAPLVLEEAGRFVEAADALGVDREVSEVYARRYGIGSGAIEYAQAAWALGKLMKKTPAAKPVAGKLQVAVLEALGIAHEGVEEVTQGLLWNVMMKQAVVRQSELKQALGEAWRPPEVEGEDYWRNFWMGAGVGGALRGAGAAKDAVVNKFRGEDEGVAAAMQEIDDIAAEGGGVRVSPVPAPPSPSPSPSAGDAIQAEVVDVVEMPPPEKSRRIQHWQQRSGSIYMLDNQRIRIVGAGDDGVEFRPVDAEGHVGQVDVLDYSLAGLLLSQQEYDQQQQAPGVPGELGTGAVGRAWRAVTPDNKMEVGGHYELIDASQVRTSGEDGFPGALQPRNRHTAASRDQVERIASDPNPYRLGESPTTDRGAPIVDASGNVLSGNGRVTGIRQAYEQGKAARYKQGVLEQARAAGIDVSGIEEMTAPLLIRRLTDTGDADMESFVEASNRSDLLARNPAEQAEADAKALAEADLFRLFTPGANGEVNTAGNRDFLNEFVRVTGADDLRTSDGGFQPSAESRVRLAMLASLFEGRSGGREQVTGIVEQMSDLGIKTQVDGIMAMAGQLRRLATEKPEYSIIGELAEALTLLMAFRRAKVAGEFQSLEDYLAQQDMFSGEASPAAIVLTKVLDRSASMKQIREYLGGYIEVVAQIDTTTDDMFGVANATPLQILEGLSNGQISSERRAEGAARPAKPDPAKPAGKPKAKADDAGRSERGADQPTQPEDGDPGGAGEEAGADVERPTTSKPFVNELLAKAVLPPKSAMWTVTVDDMPGNDFSRLISEFPEWGKYTQSGEYDDNGWRIAGRAKPLDFRYKVTVTAIRLKGSKETPATPARKPRAEVRKPRAEESAEGLTDEHIAALTADGVPAWLPGVEVMSDGEVVRAVREVMKGKKWPDGMPQGGPRLAKAVRQAYKDGRFKPKPKAEPKAEPKPVAGERPNMEDFTEALRRVGLNAEDRGRAMELRSLLPSHEWMSSRTLGNRTRIDDDAWLNEVAIPAMVKAGVVTTWTDAEGMMFLAWVEPVVPTVPGSESGSQKPTSAPPGGSEGQFFRAVVQVAAVIRSLPGYAAKYKDNADPASRAIALDAMFQEVMLGLRKSNVELYNRFFSDSEFREQVSRALDEDRRPPVALTQSEINRILRAALGDNKATQSDAPKADADAPKGGADAAKGDADAPKGGALSVLSEEKQARAEELKAELKKRLGRLNVGVDPTILIPGAELGALYLEAGVRQFGHWAAEMVDGIGEAVIPYLPMLYGASGMQPGSAAYREGMDSLDAIATLDEAGIRAAIASYYNQAEESGDGQGDNAADQRSGGLGPAAVPTSEGEPAGSPEGAGGEGGTPESSGASDRGNEQPVRRPEGPGDGQPRSTEPGGEGNRPGNAQPSERLDYVITDETSVRLQLGQKGKVRANIEAIRILKQLDAEGRLATAAEQDVLVTYSGWGHSPQMFDNARGIGLVDEQQQLRELLSDEEYEAARRSTTNAHYTSVNVIGEMWGALAEIPGLRRVMEPGSGIGLFFGRMPQEWRSKARLTGIERDPISARISQQLYQTATIHAKPFQDVVIPAGSQDLAIGNVPFAKVRIYDRMDAELNRPGQMVVHDYFIAKAIKSVRPGGLVMLLTSRYSMDKQADTARRKWAELGGRFLGAVRLPNDAFRANAGTDVVTDILVFQKQARAVTDGLDEWMRVSKFGDVGENYVNDYFLANPRMVIGRHSTQGTMYSADSYTVEPIPGYLGKQIGGALEEVLRRREVEVPDAAPRGERESKRQRAEDQSLELEEGEYQLLAGGTKKKATWILVQKINGEVVDLGVSETVAKRTGAMLAVKDGARKLLAAELDPALTEAEVEARRASLNTYYDSFVQKYGPLNKTYNRARLAGDPDWPLVMSLEHWNSETQTATKADIFTRRLQYPEAELERVDTPEAALRAAMNQTGGVDISLVAKLLNRSKEEAVAALGELVYLDPASGQYQLKSLYLSGNVKRKLEVAKQVAAADPAFARNVAALEEVQPPDKEPGDFVVPLGAPWVPIGTYATFAREQLGYQVRIEYNRVDSRWQLTGQPLNSRNARVAQEEYGTPRMTALQLLDGIFNFNPPIVRDTVGTGSNRTSVVNKEQTTVARQAEQRIRSRWAEWVLESGDIAGQLARIYNEQFNNTVQATYDGSYLTLPGSNATITLRPYQLDAISRIITTGNTLLGHVVGAGKTWTMVGAAMEMKRLGMARKPTLVVPKHLVEQVAKEWRVLYPSAKVLMIGSGAMSPQRRQVTLNQIRTGDWDGVVVSVQSFERIPVSQGIAEHFMYGMIAEAQEALMEASGSGASRRNTKDLENSIERIENRLARMQADWKKDEGPYFDELGIDTIMVDEAHGYKNLWFTTGLSQVKGVAVSDVQKSLDMLMKVSYLNQLTNYKGVVFATGTPVSNSLAEVYNMQRYLQPQELEDRGVKAFDAWAATFGEIVNDWEISVDAQTFKQDSRFRKFSNLTALQESWAKVADVVTRDQVMQHVKVPKVATGKPEVVVVQPSEFQREYIKNLVKRAENAGRTGAIDKTILTVVTDGRKLAIDQRLVGGPEPAPGTSKVDAVVEQVTQIWKDTAEQKGAQVVWLDMGVFGGSNMDLYSLMRDDMIEAGIPAEEIAFVQETKNDEAKLALYGKVNRGEVRVIFGSTETMGTGANLQQRLVAAHHLDPRWKPADIEQRDGRIIRPGNMWDEVHIYRYITEGTFDAYMWQLVEYKAKFVEDFMRGQAANEGEDLGESMSFAELKAIATGNPKILEFVKLRSQVEEMEALHRNALKRRLRAQRDRDAAAEMLRNLNEAIERVRQDAEDQAAYQGQPLQVTTVGGQVIEKREDLVAWLEAALEGYRVKGANAPYTIGEVRGLRLSAMAEFTGHAKLVLQGAHTYVHLLGNSPDGNVTRLKNLVDSVMRAEDDLTKQRANTEEELAAATELANAQVIDDGEIRKAYDRLGELEKELGMTGDFQVRESEEEPYLAREWTTEGLESNVSEDEIAGVHHEQLEFTWANSEGEGIVAGNVSGDEGGTLDYSLLPSSTRRRSALRDGLTKVGGLRLFTTDMSRTENVASVLYHLRDAGQERLMLLPLTEDGRLMRKAGVVILSVGLIDRALVDVKMILRTLEVTGAKKFILAHNHPSGDPSPSREDLLVTQSLQDTLAPLGLRDAMVDHVVINGDTAFSIARSSLVSYTPQKGKIVSAIQQLGLGVDETGIDPTSMVKANRMELPKVQTPDMAAVVLKSLVRDDETIAMLGLDVRRRVVHVQLAAEADSVEAARAIASMAGVNSVIIGLYGDRQRTGFEMATRVKDWEALLGRAVNIHDVIAVTPGKVYHSGRELGFLNGPGAKHSYLSDLYVMDGAAKELGMDNRMDWRRKSRQMFLWGEHVAGVQPWVNRLDGERRAALTVDRRQVARQAKAIRRSLRRFGGWRKRFDDQTTMALEGYFKGHVEREEIPGIATSTAVQRAVVELERARTEIDALSLRIAEGGATITESMRETLINNLGEYSVRFYRKFLDPGYRPAPEVQRAAYAYLYQQLTEQLVGKGNLLGNAVRRYKSDAYQERLFAYMVSGNDRLLDGSSETFATVARRLRAVYGSFNDNLNGMVKPWRDEAGQVWLYVAPGDMDALVQGTMSALLHKDTHLENVFGSLAGSTPWRQIRKSFIRRKAIPREIRELFGEVHDLAALYQTTALRQRQVLTTDRYQRRMKAQSDDLPNRDPGKLFYEGSGLRWTDGKGKVHDFTYPIPDTAAYGVLAGLRTNKETFDVLKEAHDPAMFSQAVQLYLGGVGVTRFLKTAANVPSVMRNFLSNGFFAVSEGEMVPWRMPGYLKAWARTFEALANPAEMDRLIEAGVVTSSAHGAELQATMRDAFGDRSSLTPETFWRGVVEYGVKLPVDAASRLYALADNVWKIASAYAKLGRGISMQEAARQVRRGYPDYGQTPRVVTKVLRRLPLVPDFVTFPVEVVRISVNNYVDAWKDMTDSRDPSRMIGTVIGQGAATFAGTWLASQAVAIGLEILTGGDYEPPDEEARRRAQSMLPAWQQMNSLVWWQRPDGTLDYLDYGYIHPYELQGKVSMILTSDLSAGEAVREVVRIFEDTFLGVPFALAAVAEAIANVDMRRMKRIYRPETDSKAEAIGKVLDLLADRLAPPMAVDLSRAYAAATNDEQLETFWGEIDTPERHLLRAATPARIRQFDPRVALESRARELYGDIRDLKSEVGRARNQADRNRITYKELVATETAGEEKIRMVAEYQLDQLVQAAAYWLSDEEIIGGLRNAGLAKREAEELVHYGTFGLPE